MTLFRTIFNTVLDAIFPFSSTVSKIHSFSPEQAYLTLPSSPLLPMPIAKHARSIFAYKDEEVSNIIWQMKYKRSDRAISICGYALLHELLSGSIGSHQENNASKILVIPMPITKRRRNERGYNQCEILLDEMIRLDIHKNFVYDKELLIRVHHDARQTLKNRGDRLASAKGIFAVNRERVDYYRDNENVFGKIDNIKVVIIDDVITTGSTMLEAIQTLGQVGFGGVTGLSIAH